MKDASRLIDHLAAESLRVQSQFFSQSKEAIVQAAATIAERLRSGRKVLLFGNGGSAADAQHIATELVGRFMPTRRAMAALSLSTDTSALTAIANDFGYERVFSRQIEALGNAGDVAIGISTSGASPNVLSGLAAARAQGLFTVGFSGESGGRMHEFCDVIFCVPARVTPRIQETHGLLGHILCELIDRELFPEAYPED